MGTLRFILCDAADGFRNMAEDEVLLEECERGHTAGALRVYQWDPPAVSLGYSQSEQLIDVEKCLVAGLNVVRRITGGGAVLHSEEITYCFVVRRELLNRSLWPRQFARLVGAAVVRGLREVGVVAVLSSGGEGAETRDGSSPLCFTLATENEVAVQGQKLAGCAHKFTKQAYFSHGSIMLGNSHARIVEFLKFKNTKADSLRVREGCISLSEVMEELPSPESVGEGLRRGFETSFAIEFGEGRLSEHEDRLVQKKLNARRRRCGMGEWSFA
jgi:lipoate-protein ligase A